MEIRDKVALVTGATGGLGGAISRCLLEKGGYVCLADIDDERGKNIEDTLTEEFGQRRVIYKHCDVTKENDVRGVFDAACRQLGMVQIVCNNAGIVAEFSPDRMIDVNLKGVCYGTTEAVARLRRDSGGQGGVIVNIASDVAVYPVWMMPAYCGTKAGVLHYTKSWAANPHRGNMGIRFNVLCPFAMDTGFTKTLTENILDVDALMAYDTANGFVGVDEVAAAFCRLVEEDRNGDVMLVSRKDGVHFAQPSYKIT